MRGLLKNVERHAFYHGRNVFILADAFPNVQETTYGKTLSTPDRRKLRATVEKEAFIQRIMDEYEDGVINKMQFVRALSPKFLVT